MRMNAGAARNQDVSTSIVNLETVRLLRSGDVAVDGFAFDGNDYFGQPELDDSWHFDSENSAFEDGGDCERQAFDGVTSGQKLFSLIASCIVALLLILIPGFYLS